MSCKTGNAGGAGAAGCVVLAAFDATGPIVDALGAGAVAACVAAAADGVGDEEPAVGVGDGAAEVDVATEWAAAAADRPFPHAAAQTASASAHTPAVATRVHP